MGDPSGRDTTRPILDEETVKDNAEKILEQVERVLLPGFTVHRNHEFFGGMNLPFFLTRLASQFTVAHMMSRDGFRKRGQSGVALHELITPILQGWDSVMLDADVEIGGTDQLFNFQISRELQANQGQTPQVCLMTPVINGTDGRKMSKSFSNCIFLDEPPEEIFGKVMSISDEVMMEWIPLLATDGFSIHSNPMEMKKDLAADIVRQIHGEDAARFAREHFEAKIQKNNPRDVVEIPCGTALEIVMKIRDCSKSQARRLIQGGALKACHRHNRISNQDPPRIDSEDTAIDVGWIVKVGKRQWAITI